MLVLLSSVKDGRESRLFLFEANWLDEADVTSFLKFVWEWEKIIPRIFILDAVPLKIWFRDILAFCFVYQAFRLCVLKEKCKGLFLLLER